jgi:hypothetical protein
MGHVFVVSGAREGSSLLVKILEAHGLWSFHPGQQNSHGYRPYESRALQDWIRERYPNSTLRHERPKPNVDLRGRVLAELPPDRRSVLKTFSSLWDVWQDAFPDGEWVLSMRDIEPTVRSHLDKSRFNDRSFDFMYCLIAWRHELLRRVSAERGLPIVNMSRVLEGDLTMLGKALKKVGIEMVPRKVERCIDRKLWRFRA